MLSWLRERNLDDEVRERAFRLADHLRNFEIPAYIVTSDDEAALRQIFDRTNTFGKQMTRAEVFHALNTSTRPGIATNQTDDQGGRGMGQNADELRRNIETTRENLGETVEAIGDRVSPGRMIERRKNRVMTNFRNIRERVLGSASDTRQRSAIPPTALSTP